MKAGIRYVRRANAWLYFETNTDEKNKELTSTYKWYITKEDAQNKTNEL